ncbi:general substrate transporter [Lipomyces orientalis]|uniref:General substrate transporter n=1 Tax=Lipomyces orientalis TaxID=1233043 RepID=A0ACC3TGI4_9ASCO
MGIFSHKLTLADTPKEVLNWRLYWSVAVFGILGASRGFDEGLVGGMINLACFKSEFPLDVGTEDEIANRKSNITSMVQLGSIGGALLAFVLCDKIGRVRSLQALCVLWATGFAIVISSFGSIPQILTGRFIAGLGIGMTTVVGPTYLVEVAPKSIRGMLTSVFAGAVYLGVMIAYFGNWGCSINISNTSRTQWVVPQSIHIIFAGFIFMLSWTVPETPRWLIMTGKREKALANLCKLRNLPSDHPFVQSEVIAVTEQLEREKESTRGTSRWGKLRELTMIPANRYRLMLGIMSQLLGQWSGASAITIYAADFFSVLGKTGQSEKLFATCILGIVKFASAYICAFFLIDFIGRRRALYCGIALQTISVCYIAIYLGVVPNSVETTAISDSARRASLGAIAAIYVSGFGWAMGWNSFQYLVNAEIYPIRLRALGSSIVMCFHFVNQFANTKAVPAMLLTMSNYGFFAFCTVICVLGLIWVWFFVPETAGKSLEAMDTLFAVPWHQIGRHGKELTADEGSHSEAARVDDMEKAEYEVEEFKGQNPARS